MDETTRPVSGIHHITAIASSAAETLRFYTEVLGLRLVKKTVNFDDPYTYHLYFGDRTGAPGTIMTFFPWEGAPRGRTGAGSITAVAFSIPEAAAENWAERLSAQGIDWQRFDRFTAPVIRFQDPDGLALELVGIENEPALQPWTGGGVAAAQAIRGFHSATATVHDAGPTRRVLQTVLGMTPAGTEAARTRFAMASPSAPGIFYDVVEDPAARPARPGGGTVHHIAFRAENDGDQKMRRRQIADFGLEVTPIIDRSYFRSIYFREAGGVLFEIATDPPGFTADESEENLGTGLMLPPQHEPRRSEIEHRLPKLPSVDRFRHLYVGPEEDAGGKTLVALHGTGGDERDLLSVARRIGGPGTALLSPRGNVVENGMNRFFRRIAEGVFDPQEVRRRALELADFVTASAKRYGRDPAGLSAVGYSNGANIAAAVMLLRPEIFTDAILFRPMKPLDVDAVPDLSGRRILVTRGTFDDVIPADSSDRLVRTLSEAGAQVTEIALDAGHRLTAEDVRLAADWWRRCTAQRCAASI